MKRVKTKDILHFKKHIFFLKQKKKIEASGLNCDKCSFTIKANVNEGGQF